MLFLLFHRNTFTECVCVCVCCARALICVEQLCAQQNCKTTISEFDLNVNRTNDGTEKIRIYIRFACTGTYASWCKRRREKKIAIEFTTSAFALYQIKVGEHKGRNEMEDEMIVVAVCRKFQ